MATQHHRNEQPERTESARKMEDASRQAREDFSRQGREAANLALEEVGERTTCSIEAVNQTSGVLMNGLQDVTREMMNWHQEVFRTTLGGTMMSLQVNFARDLMQRSLEGGRRIGEILIRMSEEAQQAVEASNRGQGWPGAGGRPEEHEAERGGRHQRNVRAA
jgi:hypothetical protein